VIATDLHRGLLGVIQRKGVGMAFSTRLTGYSKQDGSVLLRMEPPWWNVQLLRKDPRLTESNETGGYRDYDADLSLEEARELHERFKPAAMQGIYQYEGWQQIIQPMLIELDLAFSQRAAEFSHFHVCVFEWESGLD
jgi:hypothetical protein